METRHSARVLVITVEGLDWTGFESACAAGFCPNLLILRQRGVAAPLVGAAGISGHAGIATIVSGAEPECHGVWEAMAPDATGWAAVTRAAWGVPPLWETLDAAGITTGSVAMPASAPGDSWSGTHFDDSLVEAGGLQPEEWALPRRVAPVAARDAIRDRRIHPTDITGAMMLPLVPDLAGINQSRETLLPLLAVAMARAGTVQAAAGLLLAQDGPRACFVHHGWVANLREVFASIAAPPWAEVMSGAWRLLDAMIGQLAALAGEGAWVAIASPGWRGLPGVFVTAGASVAASSEFAMPALAVAPLLLRQFGLADAALAGEVPAELGPSPVLKTIRSAPFRRDPTIADEASPEHRAALLTARGAMIVRRTPAAAVALAREALALTPGNPDALRLLAGGLVLLDAPDELPALAAALRRAAPGRGWGPLADAAALVLVDRPHRAAPFLAEAEAEAGSDVETLLSIATTWLAANQPTMAQRVLKKVLGYDSVNVSARVGLAWAAILRRDYASAEVLLTGVLAGNPTLAIAHAHYATLCEQTGRIDEARRRRAIAQRYDPAGATP